MRQHEKLVLVPLINVSIVRNRIKARRVHKGKTEKSIECLSHGKTNMYDCRTTIARGFITKLYRSDYVRNYLVKD